MSVAEREPASHSCDKRSASALPASSRSRVRGRLGSVPVRTRRYAGAACGDPLRAPGCRRPERDSDAEAEPWVRTSTDLTPQTSSCVAPCHMTLLAWARRVAALTRQAPVRDKTVIALYRAPDYLRWAVESLSEAATNGAVEPATTALLEVGLSTIRQFPGVAEVCDARRKRPVTATRQTMHWLSEFPVVSVSAVETDDSPVAPVFSCANFARERECQARPVTRHVGQPFGDLRCHSWVTARTVLQRNPISQSDAPRFTEV